MKYMLMLVRDDEHWESLSPGDQDYDSIIRWWMELGAKGVLRGGEELQPARTATTLRWSDGNLVVTDGPFAESKETIGGFGIIEVENLDEAIAIARTWPARSHRVEIRPVVAH